MNQILFKRITSQGNFLSLVLAGVSSLWQSGILEILKDIGRVPVISPESPNYEHLQSTLYAWSLGYNQALDDLVYFKEKFLESDRSTTTLQPDYGGLDEALRKGDLTKEEVNELRKQSESSSNTGGTATTTG